MFASLFFAAAVAAAATAAAAVAASLSSCESVFAFCVFIGPFNSLFNFFTCLFSFADLSSFASLVHFLRTFFPLFVYCLFVFSVFHLSVFVFDLKIIFCLFTSSYFCVVKLVDCRPCFRCIRSRCIYTRACTFGK